MRLEFYSFNFKFIMTEENKISKFQAIFRNKCPKCHDGNLFEKNNPYKNITSMGAMPKRCSVCNMNFHPEPGFYFGAAYISYGLTTGLIILVVAIGLILGLRDIKIFIVLVLTSAIISTPLLFRWSRSIWIHIFAKLK